MIVIFFRIVKNSNSERNSFVQCADQHEIVHELYRMHMKLNSTVSISKKFEKNSYHQCTVEVYQKFSGMGFSKSSV